MRNDMMTPSVSITGLGVINAIGSDIRTFDNGLRQTAIGIQSHYAHSQLAFHTPAALLRDWPSLESLGRNYPWLSQKRLHVCLRKASRGLLATVAAMLEAYESAQLHSQRLDARRIGLVVAGSHFDQTPHEQAYQTFNTAPAHINPSYALSAMDNHYEGVISELLPLQGEAVSVSGASAAGNVALLHGQRMLHAGTVDVCLVVGAMADISAPLMQAFYHAGALGGIDKQQNPATVCCPFDARHQGFVYGQGAGCIILETQASQQQREVLCQGHLISTAQCTDGNHLSNPSQTGEARAMQSALEQSGLTAESIDYINAHATSTPLGDKTELAALRVVLGPHLDSCWVNSTKALIGHCLGAAGIVEAIATLLQLQGQYVHGNPNLRQPIADAGFVGLATHKTPLRYALSNSFGFSGVNSSVILSTA